MSIWWLNTGIPGNRMDTASAAMDMVSPDCFPEQGCRSLSVRGIHSLRRRLAVGRQRQPHREGAAHAFLALDLDRSPVLIHNLLGSG